LALCHPTLFPNEVRASVKPTTDRAAYRLTVVVKDRPGLLAATAGVLGFHGLSLTSASAATWPELELALQCVMVVDPDGRERFDTDWDEMGKSLRAALLGSHPVEPDFAPKPPVVVRATPHEQGRSVVSVEAPDQIGLLWALTHWFESRDCNIEATHMETDGTTARGTLLVAGEVDCGPLASALGGVPSFPWGLPNTALRVAVQGAVAVAGVSAGLAVRALRGRHRAT
jgi:UTP:GlnB (protein PII) uridylyltransferase